MPFIRKNYIRVALFVLFIALIVSFRIFDIGSWINIATIQQYEQELIEYVRQHYWQSVAIFIAVYAIENIFALPFSFVLSIMAGFVYGILPAVAYIVAGATSGAVLSFLVTRYVIGWKVQQYYQDTLVRFNRELKNNGAYYIVILRLIPVVPFFLINILAGLTNVSVWTFAITTAIGIIPGTILYASAGYQLRVVDTIGDIVTWQSITILVLLVLFVIAPVILKKWLNWKPLQKGQ